MGEVRTFGAPLFDVKAEAANLGAMLVSEGHPLDCRDVVVEKLRDAGADAFYDLDHQKIYQAIVDNMLNSQPTDPVAVVSRLRRKGELTQELMERVHSLPQEAGLLTSAVDDIGTILDLYRKRQLHQVLLQSNSLVVSASGSYEEVAGEVSGAISDLVDRAIKPETLFTAIEVVDAALGHLFGDRDVTPGIPMGISDLDELTGGMKPGQYIVIAGRPGQGKTTLGAQVARNVANAGIGCAFFSLEMGKEEFGQRDASAETGIRFDAIRDAKVDAKERRDLMAYAEEQETKPFFLDDDPEQTVGEISLKTRKLVKDCGVKVIVIDYLQITRPDGGWTGNKTDDVTKVSEALRALARKLNIVVIALAQLNRESASREDNIPKITDLRQSGQIEQDAHKVILVHLPYKYDPETERGREADLFLAKNRDGGTSQFVMVHDGAHSRFIDPAAIVGGGR